jgi:predicted CopG family antitoxin
MHKKLTISIDAEVYDRLYEVVGAGKISQFVEDLVRSQVIKTNLDSAYEAMAKDKLRETEAFEWAEAMIGDIAYE